MKRKTKFLAALPLRTMNIFIPSHPSSVHDTYKITIAAWEKFIRKVVGVEKGKFILILYKRWFSPLHVLYHITANKREKNLVNFFGIFPKGIMNFPFEEM